MSLLDGGPKSSIPAISWDSVVGTSSSQRPSTEDTTEREDSDTTADDATADDATPDDAPNGSAARPETTIPPIVAPAAFSFEPEPAPVDPSGPLQLTREPDPIPPAPAPDPEPVVAVPDPAAAIHDEIANAGAPRLADPSQPGARPDTSDASPATALVDAVPGSTSDAADTSYGNDLPPIIEATPVDSGTDPLHVLTGESPIVEAPTAAVPSMPALPSAPAVPSGPSLPNVTSVAAPVASAPLSSTPIHTHASATRTTKTTTSRKQKSGGGLGLLVVLVLLAGLVAAGIVFGRPYLFPDEWDASARDYAQDIESIRGVEFIEPLTVVAEPTTAYRQRVGDQLLGDWEARSPMWRALGLSAGGTEREVLDTLIAERSPAIYSHTDGQVYHDAALPPVEVDAEVTLAMATAALDQQYRVVSTADRRSLLAEAMTEAHLYQQATAIQEQSQAPTEIRPTNDSTLAFLPPVLDYSLVAPTVFADLLPVPDDVAANPLARIGDAGPGPLLAAELTTAPDPVLDVSEAAVGTARPMGRSFWYLVLASHLDPRVAWNLSSDLSTASLLEVSAGADTCFYSSLGMASPGGSTVLTGALTSWVDLAAPELRATTTTLEDGTVQLRTCDPGDVFTSNARFGIARDLIAFQATELATITGVVSAGGDQAAIDEALAQLDASDAVAIVLDLDPTATATEVSSTARRAVEPVLSAVPSAAQIDPSGDATEG